MENSLGEMKPVFLTISVIIGCIIGWYIPDTYNKLRSRKNNIKFVCKRGRYKIVIEKTSIGLKRYVVYKADMIWYRNRKNKDKLKIIWKPLVVPGSLKPGAVVVESKFDKEYLWVTHDSSLNIDICKEYNIACEFDDISSYKYLITVVNDLNDHFKKSDEYKRLIARLFTDEKQSC